MTPLLLDSAIRAALVIAGTAMVLWLMRIRRPATRHAAWAASVVAMLLLPLWSAAGPRVSLRVLRPVVASITVPPSSAAPVIPSSPVADEPIVDAGPTRTEAPGEAGMNWPRLLLGAYLIGAGVLVLRLIVGTFYAIRLRRDATIVHGHSTSYQCAAPITVGWFRPILILPSGWQRWPGAKLNAVLRHENEHSRRRDPLVQWLALLNRAVFWFHPLAWWLERRLAVLAEESCDAAVLAAGHSPQEYTGYLLDLARSVMARGRRVRAVGMAMPGSGLNERMRHILSDSPVPPVSRTRIICTAALCTASIVLFAGADVTRQTSHSGDSSDGLTHVIVAQEAKAAATPKFDVVSLKPCDPKAVAASGVRRGLGVSPGRLTETCVTLTSLIQSAYIRFADGRSHHPWAVSDTPVEGGPAWTKQDTFTIEATAAPDAATTMMLGPMVQVLLEDRFHLKVHRETRQGPVYDLVTAASGSKLKPAQPGVCVSEDFATFPIDGYPVPFPAGQHRCNNTETRFELNGRPYVASSGTSIYTAVWDDEAISLDELSKEFLMLGRPVVNKTGVAGLVTLHVTHTFDLTNPDDEMPAPPSSTLFNIHVAVETLKEVGLELKPVTGPRDFLVIDHVEKPTPNAPAPSVRRMDRPPATGA